MKATPRSPLRAIARARASAHASSIAYTLYDLVELSDLGGDRAVRLRRGRRRAHQSSSRWCSSIPCGGAVARLRRTARSPAARHGTSALGPLARHGGHCRSPPSCSSLSAPVADRRRSAPSLRHRSRSPSSARIHYAVLPRLARSPERAGVGKRPVVDGRGVGVLRRTDAGRHRRPVSPVRAVVFVVASVAGVLARRSCAFASTWSGLGGCGGRLKAGEPPSAGLIDPTTRQWAALDPAPRDHHALRHRRCRRRPRRVVRVLHARHQRDPARDSSSGRSESAGSIGGLIAALLRAGQSTERRHRRQRRRSMDWRVRRRRAHRACLRRQWSRLPCAGMAGADPARRWPHPAAAHRPTIAVLARVFAVQEVGCTPWRGPRCGPCSVAHRHVGRRQRLRPAGPGGRPSSCIAGFPLVRRLDSRAVLRPGELALLRQVPFLAALPPVRARAPRPQRHVARRRRRRLDVVKQGEAGRAVLRDRCRARSPLPSTASAGQGCSEPGEAFGELRCSVRRRGTPPITAVGDGRDPRRRCRGLPGRRHRRGQRAGTSPTRSAAAHEERDLGATRTPNDVNRLTRGACGSPIIWPCAASSQDRDQCQDGNGTCPKRVGVDGSTQATILVVDDDHAQSQPACARAGRTMAIGPSRPLTADKPLRCLSPSSPT